MCEIKGLTFKKIREKEKKRRMLNDVNDSEDGDEYWSII